MYLQAADSLPLLHPEQRNVALDMSIRTMSTYE